MENSNQNVEVSSSEATPQNLIQQCISASKGMLIFRGFLISLLGITFILNPVLSATIFMIAIGSLMIFNGIVTILASFKASKTFKKMFLIYGIAILILGSLLIGNPLKMDLLFMILIACWILVDGVYSIIAVFCHNNQHKWNSFWSGALSILVAILLMIWPIAGLYTFNWVLGIVIFTYGLIILGASFAIKK